MTTDDLVFGEDEKINFEFNGRELTAYAKLEYKDGNVDSVDGNLDLVLSDEILCEDADTGEPVEVTEGMKAAILFALRNSFLEAKERRAQDLEERYGEEEEDGEEDNEDRYTPDPNIRISKPDKR